MPLRIFSQEQLLLSHENHTFLKSQRLAGKRHKPLPALPALPFCDSRTRWIEDLQSKSRVIDPANWSPSRFSDSLPSRVNLQSGRQNQQGAKCVSVSPWLFQDSHQPLVWWESCDSGLQKLASPSGLKHKSTRKGGPWNSLNKTSLRRKTICLRRPILKPPP